MTKGYFYAYNIIFDAAVSGGAKLVYAYLCKCANAEGKSFPSHKTIGAAVSIGVTTVKKALAELENAGLVSVCGRFRTDLGRRSNLYTIIKEKAKGFFPAYPCVFAKKLTAKARLVYLYFCRLASGKGKAFPSHKTTAKACDLSVSGVRAAIGELEAAGFAKREAQYRENGGQKSNLYTVVEPETGGDKDAADGSAADAEREQILHTSDNENTDTGEATAGGTGAQTSRPRPETSVFSRLLKPFRTLRQSHSRDTATGSVAPKHPPVSRGDRGTQHIRKYIHNEKKNCQKRKLRLSDKSLIISAHARNRSGTAVIIPP